MQDPKLQKRSQFKFENKSQYLDDQSIEDKKVFLPNTTKIYEDSGPNVTSFVCLLVPRFEEHGCVVNFREEGCKIGFRSQGGRDEARRIEAGMEWDE